MSISTLIIGILWLVFGFNELIDVDLRRFGLAPRTLEGLLGIFTYPLLHADWKHITDNSVSGFVLCLGLFSFYGRVGWRVILWSWLMSAVWIWIAARPGNHIGFSGIIYAVASFVFFSGVLRKHIRLMSLSLVVVFLYGSMIWGVLPIQPGISWEGHLFGAMAGLILAYQLRKDGPQRPKYSWEIEEELGLALEEVEAETVPEPTTSQPTMHYIYKEKVKKEPPSDSTG